MPADIRVAGVDAMKVLARELEKAGRSDLKVEMKKEAQRFVRDNRIREAIADSAMDTLPGGGGHVRQGRSKRPRSDRRARQSVPLNKLISRAKVKTTANFRGRQVGVYVVGSQTKKGKKRDLESINKGLVRHPTFGRKPWKAQRVKPGFFDRPLEGQVARDFGQHMFRAINNIRRQVTGGGTGGRRVA